MKKAYTFLLIAILLSSTNVYSDNDYICYYLMSTEIRATVEEHERQKDLQEEQLQNLAIEKYNKSKWEEYKDLTKSIRSRLSNLSLAVQAIPTSVTIVREIEKIYDIQEKIYKELQVSPQWIPLAVQGQINFVDDLQMNIRLLAGIILSYGTINQMEKAERKILLDYAVGEIKSLRVNSWRILSAIQLAKRKEKQRKHTFDNWINKDKKIIQDIINNANAY